jgi:PAS domain S-box-containing protein
VVPNPAFLCRPISEGGSNSEIYTVSRISRRNRALALVGAAIALCPGLHALDPSKSVFQFNCQSWPQFAGLPAGEVSAIAQAKDGYIWLGGQSGLSRFDGKEFTAFPIALSGFEGQSVNSLSVAKDGQLWFSSSAVGFASSNGRVFAATENTQLGVVRGPSNVVLAARDGAVWAGSSAGWVRSMDGTVVAPADPKAQGPVTSLSEDSEGRVWIGTEEHGLSYWAGGKTTSLPDPELKKRNVLSVAEDRSGDVWVATSQGLYRYDPQLRRREVLFPAVQINVVLVDSHGVLWAGVDGSGLFRYADGKFTTLRKGDGLVNDNVTALFEDAEGSLWVGTNDGLSQITDLKFPLFSAKEGFMPASAVAVCASHFGGLWVATPSGAIYSDGKTVRNLQDPNLFPTTNLRRVFEARNGEVYFSDGLRNVFVISGDRPTAIYPNNYWPESFAEDSTSVIVGVGPRIMRIKDGRVQPYGFQGAAEPELDWVTCLCVSRTDTIWAATNHGLLRVKDGKYRQWTTAEGLPSDRITFVTEDLSGTIWAGLPSGLVSVTDDRLTYIGAADGLPDTRIFAIVPDDLGYFWMDTARGILRIARKSLMDFTEGKTKHVEGQIFDGPESNKFSDRDDGTYSGCRTNDGRIWFPSPHGVIMVDPAHYFTNRVPPFVSIQEIRVDGRIVTDHLHAKTQVGAKGVEFFFSALSYIAPEKVRVRYRLEGLDPTWVEAGANRSVAYGNLKAGQYVFKVQAANADGVWNTDGDSLSIGITPPFYQRPWFYALLSLLAALVGYRLYGLKARQERARQRELQSQNELLEAKVELRTDELASSLSLLRATLDSTPDGILAIQISNDSASWNIQFVEMWGISAEVLERKNGEQVIACLATFVHNGADFTRRIKASQAAPDTESFDSVDMKDGRKFERYCKPQYLGGQISGIVLHFRDVTDRKRIEEALTASEKRFKAMFEQAAVGVAQVDVETGRFVQINKRFCEIMGRSEIEMGQQTLATLIHPDELDRYLVKMQELRSGALRESTREGRFVRKDGADVWVNLTTSAMWAPAEKPDFVIAVAEDTTNRKRLEEQFRQSQKMDAIGTLAGGIAHDFNNILTIINGYTELAQMEVQENPLASEYLGTVRVAANRATDLVRQILTFSRQQPLERRPILLLPIVTETLKMLRSSIPSTIEFDLSLASDSPRVFADATQIHQILMNLGTNAWYAMKDRTGRLEVKLERCVVDAAFASMQPRLQPGVYARLSVGDTGCGMDQATLGRIFEPFFTTKPPGEGTGLGLAVVHGIMDNHDGVITASSQPGKGTVFHLYFPEYIGEAVLAAAHEGPLPRGNGERILMVDDEELLVQLGKQALSALGYRVEVATRPEAALAMVRDDPERFSLVFVDQTMPGMTGLALASLLRQIQPDLPIILMTGNNLSLTPENVAAAGILRVLIKPSSLHTLGCAAHDALCARHALV